MGLSLANGSARLLAPALQPAVCRCRQESCAGLRTGQTPPGEERSGHIATRSVEGKALLETRPRRNQRRGKRRCGDSRPTSSPTDPARPPVDRAAPQATSPSLGRPRRRHARWGHARRGPGRRHARRRHAWRGSGRRHAGPRRGHAWRGHAWRCHAWETGRRHAWSGRGHSRRHPHGGKARRHCQGVQVGARHGLSER